MLQRLHFFLSINRVALKRRVSERKGVNNQVIVDLFFIPVEMIRPLPRDYERRDTISRWFHVRASANGGARKWDQVDQIACLSTRSVSVHISSCSPYSICSHFLFSRCIFLFFFKWLDDVHLMRRFDRKTFFFFHLSSCKLNTAQKKEHSDVNQYIDHRGRKFTPIRNDSFVPSSLVCKCSNLEVHTHTHRILHTHTQDIRSSNILCTHGFCFPIDYYDVIENSICLFLCFSLRLSSAA